MKARLYHFNKKTYKQDERSFDRVYRDLHCVTRANDPSKVLADNALTMLTNLVSMLLASPNKKICVNQDFLSDITGKETDQNSNLLKQLKDIVSYKYHRMAHFEGKRYNYCYVIEFSKDGEKRTSNPELFYTIDSKINLVRRGKKFGLIAEKIRASYISNIREIKREREEEPLGYSSSLSLSQHKTRAREAKIFPISKTHFEEKIPEQATTTLTLAYGSVNEPARDQDTEETQAQLSYFPKSQAEVTKVAAEVIPLGETAEEEKQHYRSHKNRDPGTSGLSLLQDIPLLASLLDPSTPSTSEIQNASGNEDAVGSKTTKKDEEITPMKAQQIPPESTRNMMFELSGAIFKSFGSVRSEEIMENCKFTLIDSNKLGVKVSDGFVLPAKDRELLRSCIRSVYGDAITIVSSTGLKTSEPERQIAVVAQFGQRLDKWDEFRKELLNFFPKNTRQHILSAWFDKLSISEDKQDNKIILTGASCYVDYIYRSFGVAIEHVVKKNKVSLELCFKNNDERPIIYKPNGGF